MRVVGIHIQCNTVVDGLMVERNWSDRVSVVIDVE